jgi:kynurenine formamidase
LIEMMMQNIQHQIQANSFVVGFTGWSRRWGDPDQYRNVVNGSMCFPGFSQEAAELLLERNVAGVGIDTLSPDGSNMEFPVHLSFLRAGKVLLENLTNLDRLPAAGSYILALPLKIKGGTESPIRAVGLIP